MEPIKSEWHFRARKVQMKARRFSESSRLVKDLSGQAFE